MDLISKLKEVILVLQEEALDHDKYKDEVNEMAASLCHNLALILTNVLNINDQGSVKVEPAKKLWHFFWDCGHGAITGLFIATQEKVDSLIGKNVYFGEALGKHSEIEGCIKKGDIQLVDVSQETIFELERALGTTLTGYNPLDYIDESQPEHLTCKTCGYKQYDSDTIHYYKNKNEGVTVHDIDYTCGACIDMLTREEE